MRGFYYFARAIQRITGSPQAFTLAATGILAWLICGPIFHWSDGWELFVNTVTTVVSFLMAFVVQGALNRQNQEDHEQWTRMECDLAALLKLAARHDLGL